MDTKNMLFISVNLICVGTFVYLFSDNNDKSLLKLFKQEKNIALVTPTIQPPVQSTKKTQIPSVNK